MTFYFTFFCSDEFYDIKHVLGFFMIIDTNYYPFRNEIFYWIWNNNDRIYIIFVEQKFESSNWCLLRILNYQNLSFILLKFCFSVIRYLRYGYLKILNHFISPNFGCTNAISSIVKIKNSVNIFQTAILIKAHCSLIFPQNEIITVWLFRKFVLKTTF